MTIFKILCLLTIVSIVHCQKKQFCFPKQWQTGFSFLNASEESKGPKRIILGVGDEFFDGVGQRVRTDTYTPLQTSKILELYREHIGYCIIDNKCTKYKLGPWPNETACTPENATVSKPYRLGYKPSISVVDYSFPLLFWNVIVSATDSALVGLKIYGIVFDDLTVFTSTAEDFAPAIRDKHVFDVPAICKHAKEEKCSLLSGHHGRPFRTIL